jgi:hypothetical protein
MFIFVNETHGSTSRVVAININQIAIIREVDKRAAISFGHNSTLTVSQTREEVMSLIARVIKHGTRA